MEKILHLVVLGECIKKTRKMQGFSQKTLAEKAQIAQSTLVYIENGTKATNVDNLVRLCEALSISMLELAIMIDVTISEKQNMPIDNVQVLLAKYL